VPWLKPPPCGEILALAVSSETGIQGLLAPAAAAHALLLIAHSWAHLPLTRIGDLIDVAAVLGPGDRQAAGELARRWGWEGMWRTTINVVDRLFAGAHAPAAAERIWARHLESARERIVLENHLARIAAPAFGLPLTRAPWQVTKMVARSAGRRDYERWSDKLRRSRLAVAHAFMDSTEHESTIPCPSTRGAINDPAAADR
jgi:hypothetical protein